MLLAACKTAASLYATRFFLGIFEAVSDITTGERTDTGRKTLLSKHEEHRLTAAFPFLST